MHYLTFAEDKLISMNKKTMLGKFCVNTRKASITKLLNRDRDINIY